jgi:cobalt-zinc-cadmium efflux system membrane fusion protein
VTQQIQWKQISILVLLLSAGAFVFVLRRGNSSGSGLPDFNLGKKAGTEISVPVGEQNCIVLPAGSPKLRRIRVEPARMTMFPVDEVVAPGKVEVNPNRVSRVVMPVPGRVREVLVKLGDAVADGQPLLLVDSPEAGASLSAYRQAQAQLRQANSALSKAEKDLSRQRELYDHGAAAVKDIIAGENDVVQAQLAVEQAHAASEEASHRFDLFGFKPGMPSYVTLRALIPGKILDILVVSGEYRTDTSAAVMTIADLRSVWIGADVPESAIRLIEKGEPIVVELSAYPGEIFRAPVMRIADTVDPQTRTIKVEAEINNFDGRLRPEMFGRIRHSHGTKTLLAVQGGAVLQKEGSNIVMLEESQGCFRERPVVIGIRTGDLVPVLSGLSAGDRVVVDGAMLLRTK